MRILHVIPSMAAEAGGPPVVCAGLAGALAVRNHALTIATLDSGSTHPVAAAHVRQVFLKPDEPGAPGYASSRALTRWLDENIRNFDIVHLHSLWQFPTFAAARACWNARVPYVVLLNGMLDRYSVTHRSVWKKRLYWLMREHRIHARAAGIHCLNRAEIRRAMPWIATMPKFVIGNAIRAEELAQLPPRGQFRALHPEFAGAPLALFLSRLHPKKGLDRLIPAWKIFTARIPNGKLIIAGGGDAAYVAALDRLIAAEKMSDAIRRVGQLTGLAKWQALVDADIFVLPSHQEGFSMAITEALAAGCPPVATEECNFDELREQDCGIIVSGGDMAAFADVAAALLTDTAARQKFAANGRAYVGAHCTWEEVAAQMEKVYTWIKADKPLPADGSPVWR